MRFGRGPPRGTNTVASIEFKGSEFGSNSHDCYCYVLSVPEGPDRLTRTLFHTLGASLGCCAVACPGKDTRSLNEPHQPISPSTVRHLDRHPLATALPLSPARQRKPAPFFLFPRDPASSSLLQLCSVYAAETRTMVSRGIVACSLSCPVLPCNASLSAGKGRPRGAEHAGHSAC